MSISLSLAVSMMIGTVDFWRSARQTSIPDSPGSMRSSSTRSAPRAVELGERVVAGLGDADLVALLAQEVGQRVGVGQFVLDDEDAGHRCCSPCAVPTVSVGVCRAPVGGRGSLMVKVEPWPSSLHTDTSPPWVAQMCLTMARPRPVPPVARDRAASTR